MNKPLSLDELLTQHCQPLKKDAAFSPATIRKQLAILPDWTHAGEFISRTYKFGNYYETIAFVNAIAYIVHREDHHPDLLVSYNRCTVKFNTHSAGGISLNDFICAAKCDAVFSITPVTVKKSA